MNRNCEMLKKMAELRVISDFCSEKLINRFHEDDKGQRFVNAIVKNWRRDGYFIKTYEERLMNEWKNLQEYLKTVNLKVIKKKQPVQQVQPVQPVINFDIDKANEHYKQLKKVGSNKVLFKQLVNETNNIYNARLYRIDDNGISYNIFQDNAINVLIDEFKSKCKDKLLNRKYEQLLTKTHFYLADKSTMLASVHDDGYVDRIYYNNPIEV